MATNYKNVDAGCPFYQSNSATEIRCEGLTDSSTICWKLRKVSEVKTAMQFYCCRAPQACPIYKMLMETKYKEDDGS